MKGIMLARQPNESATARFLIALGGFWYVSETKAMAMETA
jgi:hypothetical protein